MKKARFTEDGSDHPGGRPHVGGGGGEEAAEAALATRISRFERLT